MKKELILQKLEILNRLQQALKSSVKHIKDIDVLGIDDWREWEPIDAFFDRFERLVDFTINQMFRTIYFLEEYWKNPTKKEVVNLMLKLNIIENTEDIIDLVNLRNRLAHEYIWFGIANIQTMIDDILEKIPLLFKIIHNVEAYFRKNWYL